MSQGRFLKRGFAFQSFAFRTWGLAGAGEVVVTNPVAGWTARPAQRHFVASAANRVSITTPQDRVWIARADNG
jgi:hypothetical protein